MPNERLFRAELAEREVLWLAEADPLAIGNLRVFIAVDCSDSHWPKLEPKLEPVLSNLLSFLRSEDRVEVWALGEDKARWRLTLDPGQRSTASLLRAALSLTDRGTWFHPTLPCIFASKCERGEVPVLVVITDGEVFDADRPLRSSFERSCVLGASNRTAQLSNLLPNASVQTLEQRSFGTLFERPTVSAVLRVNWSGTRAYVFGSGERPEVEELGDWSKVAARDGTFRVALLNGAAPQLSVIYVSGCEQWEEALTISPAVFVPQAERRLEQVRSRVLGLQGRVRRDLREALATGRSSSFSCGYCRDSFQLADLLRQELICPTCRCARIVDGIAYARDAGFSEAKKAWATLAERGRPDQGVL